MSIDLGSIAKLPPVVVDIPQEVTVRTSLIAGGILGGITILVAVIIMAISKTTRK